MRLLIITTMNYWIYKNRMISLGFSLNYQLKLPTIFGNFYFIFSGLGPSLHDSCSWFGLTEKHQERLEIAS